MIPRVAAIPVVLLMIWLAACTRPEGELVVYSAGPRPLAEAVCREFTATTGIPVRLYSATTGQVLAKLEAEKFRPRADVVLLAGTTAVEGLKAAGRLRPYRPSAIGATETRWHDPDGYFHATAAACVGIALRDDHAPPGGGWRDLLLSPQAAHMVMPSPTRSGAAADFLLAFAQEYPETFIDDFLAARRAGMHIVGANSQAITGVMSGAYGFVYAAADYLICREIARGEPLAVHFPGNTAAFILRPIAILSSTRSPEAAERFVDTYFSETAQTVVAENHLLPALRAVPVDPVRARFGIPEAMPVDAMQALDTQRKVMREFEYRIERAVITQ